MTDVATIVPLAGDRRRALELAGVEYDRFLAVLDTLGSDDWARPTDCPLWSVRDMVAHVLGAMEGNASMRENLHQMRAARRRDEPLVDALGVVQISERRDCSEAELVERFRKVAPAAVRGRRRTPAPMRAVRMKVDMPYGSERWRLGFLIDVIYTRDVWMHRVDIARAVGRPLELDAAHDGVLVADVVAEWARRHGRPFTLVLGGPAGGTFTAGTEGERLELDAVEFCRIVSGRAEGEGLLGTEVPF